MNEIFEISIFGDWLPHGIDKSGNRYIDKGKGWELEPKTDYEKGMDEIDEFLGVK